MLKSPQKRLQTVLAGELDRLIGDGNPSRKSTEANIQRL